MFLWLSGNHLKMKMTNVIKKSENENDKKWQKMAVLKCFFLTAARAPRSAGKSARREARRVPSTPSLPGRVREAFPLVTIWRIT